MIVKKNKKSKLGLLTMAGLWVMFVLLTLNTTPNNQLIELVVVAILGMAIYWTVTLLFSKKKWGLIASMGVLGILLMNRWIILDWLTIGLWIVVLGVIGLVN